MAVRVWLICERIVDALAPEPEGFRYKSSLPTEIPTMSAVNLGYCFTAAASASNSFVTIAWPLEHHIPSSNVVPVLMAASNADDGVAVVPYSISRALVKPVVPVKDAAAVNSGAKFVPALPVLAL